MHFPPKGKPKKADTMDIHRYIFQNNNNNNNKAGVRIITGFALIFKKNSILHDLYAKFLIYNIETNTRVFFSRTNTAIQRHLHYIAMSIRLFSGLFQMDAADVHCCWLYKCWR